MRFHLLRCLAQAVAKNGVKFLCGLVPGGDALFDIASDAWQDYCQGQQENALRAELQALAQASPEQVQQEVEEAVRVGAAGLSDDVRQKLTAYLGQVPGMIRRSLRRPSDPTGKTVPANFSLRHAEDLLPFLPLQPPRFQAGSRPLPGVPWVLEEPLGVGGFGEVWKARHAHMRNKPPVALKFCLDPSAAKVLRNEAGVLDRLMRHGRMPGIVPLMQAYLDADPPCLEYEYVEGGDLAALIREWHAQRALSAAWANWLLLQLAETIAAAHRADPAIVHDDLKPSNILVQRAADGPKLYVTDYGIGGLALARAVKQTRQPTNSREQLLTEAVRGAYTPLYASPQQMMRRRDESADPRDDVHALGVIWYQLVTGDLTMVRIPADWTDELRGKGLSEDLTRLLGACLASKAEKRPASAGILAGELRALMTPTPVPLQPAPAATSPPPKAEARQRPPQPEAAPPPKKQEPPLGKTTVAPTATGEKRPGFRWGRLLGGCLATVLKMALAVLLVTAVGVLGWQWSLWAGRVDAVERFGGRVTRENIFPTSRVTYVNLSDSNVKDADLKELASLNELQWVTSLNISNTAVTDAGLKGLAPLKRLRAVYVGNCKGVTDAGIAELQKELPGCQIERTSY